MTPREQEQFLALSDERDSWQRLAEHSWREGYRCGQQSMAGEYERGQHDAALTIKRLYHGTVADLRAHLAMWDGLRTAYGRPRPGDLTPAQITTRARASWDLP